jgi:dCMP deaminase
MKKYDTILMKTALIWSTLSSCERKQVGCIISKNSRIISNGYNGTVSGADNCCEDDCKVCNGIGSIMPFEGHNESIECENCSGKGLVSKNTVVHAEANAILSATKEGISLDKCSIYVTLSPCVECSKLIIQSGITDVYYNEKYRKDEGVNFLKENGVNVTYLEEIK